MLRSEMAKLNIQQETFDNYVKENIEELGLCFYWCLIFLDLVD